MAHFIISSSMGFTGSIQVPDSGDLITDVSTDGPLQALLNNDYTLLSGSAQQALLDRPPMSCYDGMTINIGPVRNVIDRGLRSSTGSFSVVVTPTSTGSIYAGIPGWNYVYALGGVINGRVVQYFNESQAPVNGYGTFGEMFIGAFYSGSNGIIPFTCQNGTTLFNCGFNGPSATTTITTGGVNVPLALPPLPSSASAGDPLAQNLSNVYLGINVMNPVTSSFTMISASNLNVMTLVPIVNIGGLNPMTGVATQWMVIPSGSHFLSGSINNVGGGTGTVQLYVMGFEG